MTFESEIIEILRRHDLRHVSAILREDGTVNVSVQVRKPPRVKGFDPAAHYRENRERIRKYQREYYLGTRGKYAKKGTPEAVTYIPTPQDLAKAMAYLYSKDGMILKEEDLRDTAVQVMQFFGFEKEVVGNHLEQDEIALMYQLEDVGLISTRIEEYNLLDGNPWRVNYFILNARKIREYSSMKVEENPSCISQVYQDLPEEAWVR